MSEFSEPVSQSVDTEVVDFRVVASGSLNPRNAAELQRRVLEVFSAIDGLSYSVTLGQGEPTEPEKEETYEDKELRQWLDTNFLDVLKESRASKRTTNCVGYEKISTVRQALLYGRSRFMDIRNFGVKCMTEIDVALDNNSFGITFQENPSLEYAVTICTDLTQLPAYFAIKSDYLRSNTSIVDILNMPISDIAARYVSKRPVKEYNLHEKQYIENPYTAEEQQRYIDEAIEYKQQAEECGRKFDRIKAAQ